MANKIFLILCLVVLIIFPATSTLAQIPTQNEKNSELAPHVPGEALVRFTPGMTPPQTASKMAEMGVVHKREIPAIGVHLVKLPPGLSIEKALERFDRMPGVEFVEPNYILQIQAPAAVVVDEHDQ